jgi:hypothetical protein
LMPSKFTTIIKCDGMAQMLEGLEHLLEVLSQRIYISLNI